MTVVAFAPNWLGDAVMALPALADLRRHFGGDRLVVAARASVAPLFDLVAGVDAVVPLGPGGGLLAASRVIGRDADAIRETGASTAILFPNSWRSAATAYRAGVAERWGFSRDLRGMLLTRGVGRPGGGLHQLDVYRHLVAGVGITTGSREPVIDVPPSRLDAARAMLTAAGWDGRAPLVGFAPGAAYGAAKRWLPERVAAVAAALATRHGATCVVVGSTADAGTAADVLAEAGRIGGSAAAGRFIDLTGKTSLPELAGVLAACRVFVSNDSGAMHLAAAVGTSLVAVFGPTNERATCPVARPGVAATIIVGHAWCRPCGFRECPLDHRCMRRVSADQVLQAVSAQL